MDAAGSESEGFETEWKQLLEPNSERRGAGPTAHCCFTPLHLDAA